MSGIGNNYIVLKGDNRDEPLTAMLNEIQTYLIVFGSMDLAFDVAAVVEGSINLVTVHELSNMPYEGLIYVQGDMPSPDSLTQIDALLMQGIRLHRNMVR